MQRPLPPLRLKQEVEQYLKEIYCNQQIVEQLGKECSDTRFTDLLSKLSTPPCNTVARVNTLHYTREDVRQQLQQVVAEQYQQKCYDCPVVEPHPVLGDTLVILSDGPNVDMQRHDKEVIVSALCGNAVLRGADVFIPGIMAAHPYMQSGDHVSVYADTDSLCRKGSIKKYDGIKVYVGNGVAQVSRSDIFTENDINSGVGIKMTEPLYSAPSLNAVLPDCMFLQNLPSIVVGHVMSPQSGDIVLDMCAAPGGKTTHLSSLMNDKGVVIAIDRAQSKVSRIDLNICKLNLHCIKTFAYDSTRLFSPDVPVIDADSLGKPPYPAETFDKILLDGPCSALGQRPQLISTASLKEVQSYPSLQRKIFANAVPLLKPGGILVYSTCTITLAENEGIVQWALKEFPQLKLDKQVPHLGGPGMLGTSLSNEQLELLQRFDPLMGNPTNNIDGCHRDTICFFIAKFIKAV